MAALVDEAVRQYGRLDVMVNNAGRMQQNHHTPFDEIRIQDFDATFKLNVRGHLLGMIHAARSAPPVNLLDPPDATSRCCVIDNDHTHASCFRFASHVARDLATADAA